MAHQEHPPLPGTGEFEAQRGRLFGLAYRMLGVRADAEDVVQDAFVRWHTADRAAIRNPEAWLVTAATRLAIDRLRAKKTERESYVGPWLPEPIMSDRVPPPDYSLDLASDLSVAFMVLLEKLGPDERAAFLLHDVFDVGYAEIAGILGKSEAACRQMIHRARERVRGDGKRFEASEGAKAALRLEAHTMNPRVDATAYLNSGLAKAMQNLQREVENSGLDHKLLELIKIRASQINGCAYCIDMHTKDARAIGETEQRIYALSAWHEAPFYTDRERAALEWTEAVTKLSETHVPDDVYERVSKVLDERDLVALTFAIVTINGWNRLAVSFRARVGTYQPRAAAAAAH